MRWAGHWNLTGERRGVCRVFAGEDLREGTTWKTEMQMEGYQRGPSRSGMERHRLD